MKKFLAIHSTLFLTAALAITPAFAAEVTIDSIAPTPGVLGENITITCSSDFDPDRTQVRVRDIDDNTLVRTSMNLSGRTATYTYTIPSNEDAGTWQIRCRFWDGSDRISDYQGLEVVADAPPGGGGGIGDHSSLTWNDYPSACLNCHQDEYSEMMGSTHYKWVGETPDMVNQPGSSQGKLTNAVNSYCINIVGDWPVCGSCHVGRGKRPDDPTAGAENVDCLMCHSEEYATQRARQPDGTMGVASPTDSMVQNISKPTRAACLQCHAKAGGGDAVKRGDLSLATISNSDANFDVHMNTSGTDMQCRECHVFENHKTIGKGSDLRPTDDLARGAEIKCSDCHGSNPHGSNYSPWDKESHPSNAYIRDRHANENVSCQTCHIPTYAKVATEVHRDWSHHHDGSPADGVSGPGHPHTDKAANLTPEYLWWNRLSDNHLLGDNAELTYDAAKDTYPTSRPIGSFMDGKIYPFKYKTAYQPIARGGNCDSQLIALDTFVYLKGSGDVNEAITNGLTNMGCTGATVEWITTDTYQMLNHGVNPKSTALQCNDCHDMSGETPAGYGPLDFGALGYHTWPAKVKNCTLCHEYESENWQDMHEKHAEELGKNCIGCHTTEPTGWIEPVTPYGLCNNCHSASKADKYFDDWSSSERGEKVHKKHVDEDHDGEQITCTNCHTF